MDAYVHLLDQTKLNPTYVLLTASKDVVKQRILARGLDVTDRFEENIERTVDAYKETATYLESKGWEIIYLDAEKKVEDIIADLGKVI